jgi:hypothetical protein
VTRRQRHSEPGSPRVDLEHLRAVLRDPYLAVETIERMLEIPEVRQSSELRGELVRHPQTPVVVALQLVHTLTWRDLAETGADLRTTAPIRHAASVELAKRLPSLTLGERIALARRAPPAVIEQLHRDREPRVIAALFENSRLTEGQVVRMATDQRTAPKVLLLVGNHPRWSASYEVRLALCRNPNAPLQISVPALKRLRLRDRRELSRDPRLPSVLRREAERSQREGA